MDIVEIGVSVGDLTNFMDLVHPSMKEKCQKYVKKSGGPSTIFKETNEKPPIQYLEEAFSSLIKYNDEIAMVIDGSTTRGFTEPSQASLYAQHLKIPNPNCFDVSEACNGFSRALEIAYMTFQTSKKMKDKYILIINNEQPPDTRAILPTDITDYKAVASYYVGLTFSNVCTCTIVKKSENNSWVFLNQSDPIYASHISIPLPKVAKGYLPKTEAYDVILNEQYGQFCLPRLHQVENKFVFFLGNIESRKQLFKESNLICHTFSKSIYETILSPYQFGKFSLYYNETGNLGSCSLPYILYDQYGAKVPEGEKIAWFGNAAGGSDYMITFEQGSSSQEGLIHEDKNIGKYELYIKYAFKILLNKIFCRRKNQNSSLQNKYTNMNTKTKVT